MASSFSGSFQSSSSGGGGGGGGDNDDHDSLGDSLASFLNSTATPPPGPPPVFDSFSPYLASFPFSFPFPPQPERNSLPLDSLWPKPIHHTSPPHFSSNSGSTAALPSVSAPAASAPPPPPPPSSAAPDVPRGSKKRSRASRRAPTTVLATDTSNFRAMVQQFTGFPTPPFATAAAPSGSFSRPRLHLFDAGASSISTYLLPKPSFLSSSSSFFNSAPLSNPKGIATAASSCSSNPIFDGQYPKFDPPSANFVSQTLLQSATSLVGDRSNYAMEEAGLGSIIKSLPPKNHGKSEAN